MIGGLRYLRPQRIAKADRDAALNRIERAIDTQERKIRDAFLESVEQIRDVATLEAIAERLEAGDADGVLRLLSSQDVANALQPMEAAISTAVVEGGRIAAENQPPVRGPSGNKVNFTFNVSNPKISSFAQEVSATRVREVSEDVQAVIRDIVREETVAGRNPRDAARRIRESIGLTAKQERAVSNYRRALEQGDRSALERELRDRRFDASARRAIQGEALSQDKIDRMVQRYRERFLRYRAETIGRTEATRALNGASREFMQYYVDQGLISEQQVRRFWHTARDERVRSSHRQIPAMNENGVGLGEAFETPLGRLRYPGDPRGLAENTVNCRCTTFDRVISAELAFEDAE